MRNTKHARSTSRMRDLTKSKTLLVGFLLASANLAPKLWAAPPSTTAATQPSGSQATTPADLRSKAEQGDAAAQCALGLLYHRGEGVAKDFGEAAKWYRKAADQGNAKAQFYLGILCENGTGTVKDVAEAAKWFRKAAEQGLSWAQFNLGRLYFTGAGVKEDKAEAAKWFTKAAEQGDGNSQVNLSSMYAEGMGVPKDQTESLAWITVAAISGNEIAIRHHPILENRYGAQVIESAKKRSNEILQRIEALRAARPDYVPPATVQEAAEKGDLLALKNVLAKGADVNTKDDSGATALMWAVSRNQQPVVEFLLTNGAAVDATTEDKTTALHFACWGADAETVRLLLKKGASASAKTATGETPLHRSAKRGAVEIARALVEAGADVNDANQDGVTAMHHAARRGHLALVEFLLSKKADVNAVTKESQPPRTPLLMAAWNNHPDVVELLVKQGAKDNWLTGVPGFDPAEVHALVLSVGEDGTIQVGSIPFFLGAHTATRPWKAPAERASRSGGNNLFRWETLPKGDASVTLVAIEDERGNRTSAKAILPAFIGEGGIIYTDGVSSVGKDGPFAEIQIVWQKKRQGGQDPVSSGKLILSRREAKVDLVTDKDGRCKYLLSHVVGNEPITITFKSDDGKDAGQVDFDCVIRGASESCARFMVTRMD